MRLGPGPNVFLDVGIAVLGHDATSQDDFYSGGLLEYAVNCQISFNWRTLFD